MNFLSTKNSKYLASVTISDVHLHHPRTPTTLIVDNLIRELFHNEEVKNADILWISGDLFDRLVTVADQDLSPIMFFIGRLLFFCEQHNVALRVLEGTGSHDYGQSSLIGDFLKNSAFKVDFKYFDQLTIDYDERFGIHVLYVPDELNSDASITWQQIQALCATTGIAQVDYAIMHGLFETQLPEHVHQPGAHLTTRFYELVKRFVLIGHHHVHRIFGNIIVPGSFDRLAHGEEGPKGYIRIKDYGTRADIQFVENKASRIYRTINLADTTLEEALLRLDSEITALPAGSAVLIKAGKKDPISHSMDLVRSRYLGFVITSQFEKEDSVSVRLEEVVLEYNPIRITESNIVELVAARLSKLQLSGSTHDLAIELLEATK